MRRLNGRHDELEEERKHLEEAGSSLSRDILELARKLQGETVAERFEDIAIEDAGVQEARLGPLVSAIVVDDPQGAAQAAAMTGDRPESVWLATTGAIAGADVAQGPQGERIGNTVIVQSTQEVWRVTEIPDRPVLGRSARERRLEVLKRDAEAVASEAGRLSTRQREIEKDLSALDGLVLKLKDIEAYTHRTRRDGHRGRERIRDGEGPGSTR